MGSLSPRQLFNLDQACKPIAEVFGVPPYLVGSSAAHEKRRYRDVDVRLILVDAQFDQLRSVLGDGGIAFLGFVIGQYLEGKTNLPIDFQVQRMTEANRWHTGARNPVGCRGLDEFKGDATPVSVPPRGYQAGSDDDTPDGGQPAEGHEVWHGSENFTHIHPGDKVRVRGQEEFIYRVMCHVQWEPDAGLEEPIPMVPITLDTEVVGDDAMKIRRVPAWTLLSANTDVALQWMSRKYAAVGKLNLESVGAGFLIFGKRQKADGEA